MHPAIQETLRWFEYDHLQHPPMREVSRKFHDLAHELAEDSGLDGRELTHALRHLLIAKDAAVRAAVDPPDPS